MKKSGRFFLIAVFAALLCLLILEPERYLDSVSEGLQIYVESVLPGLFPFLVLTGILTALGVGNIISEIIGKPTSRLFGAPPVGGYVLAVSMLSGYPVGAKTVADFYENGIIDERGARVISAFASTSGPIFILGTIGVKMLDDYCAGVIILASHFIATMLNGIIFKGFNGSYDDSVACLPVSAVPGGSVFNGIIESSVSAVMRVGACMVFFNMIITALSDGGALALLGKCLEYIGFAGNGAGEGVASGLIEVTKGAYIIAECGVSLRNAVPLLALLVSFGGASIALQSMCFLSKTGIKTGYYLCTKVSQGILAYAIATVMALIFL